MSIEKLVQNLKTEDTTLIAESMSTLIRLVPSKNSLILKDDWR